MQSEEPRSPESFALSAFFPRELGSAPFPPPTRTRPPTHRLRARWGFTARERPVTVRAVFAPQAPRGPAPLGAPRADRVAPEERRLHGATGPASPLPRAAGPHRVREHFSHHPHGVRREERRRPIDPVACDPL